MNYNLLFYFIIHFHDLNLWINYLDSQFNLIYHYKNLIFKKLHSFIYYNLNRLSIIICFKYFVLNFNHHK
jgi:hypothetical protein